MWIDTHAHLYDYSDDDLKNLIDSMQGASVGLIVSTATDLVTAEKVIYHCSMSPLFYGAIGITPFDIEGLNPDWKNTLRRLLDNKNIIALGEIGLDSTNPRYPELKKQLPVFESQLQIANDKNIPVIIHSRGIEQRTAEICIKNNITKAVFHCFTGNYDAAKVILDAGYYISFSGIITFKNAEIRTLLPRIPLDRIMIETDTPYLAPVPFRGKNNTPLYLRHVGEAVAGIVQITSDNLQIALERNFKKCFNIY